MQRKYIPVPIWDKRTSQLVLFQRGVGLYRKKYFPRPYFL